MFFGATQRLHWSFPDPSKAQGDQEQQLAVYRQVRDAIREDRTRATAGPDARLIQPEARHCPTGLPIAGLGPGGHSPASPPRGRTGIAD